MWLMAPSGRLLALIVTVAAAAAVTGARAADGPGTSIFVVTHHWHTGIAVKTLDLPPGRWPDARAFAGSELVEVGWGDRDFWMAPRETVGLALKAALVSEASVLRVLWFDGPVERALPSSDVVEMPVSRAGLAGLVEFVAESYARTPEGLPVDLGPGPVPESRFYLATGRYHLLNTSNRWTAQALIRAGLPFSSCSLTARRIMCQAAGLGRVIRLREPCGSSPTAAPGREEP
jgi:uncharacterized protein (TIGR02117 family)